MDSWKYALDEVKKLVQDIGRDFLTMWNQEATIAMFADILHIIGGISVWGSENLAKNFREAERKQRRTENAGKHPRYFCGNYLQYPAGCRRYRNGRQA